MKTILILILCAFFLQSCITLNDNAQKQGLILFLVISDMQKKELEKSR